MGVVKASLSKTFEYFSQFEKYPERYYKYCSQLDILEKKDNVIVTREIWNMTPNKDFDHVTIKVKYTLIPEKEIQYEVIDGFGTGIIKNKFTFEKRDEEFTLVEDPYVVLEIFAKFMKNDNHPLLLHMHDHFMWRNMKLLEGKQTGYETGDPCPHCNTGHLTYCPKKEITEEKNKLYEEERFLCNKCDKISTVHKIQSNETALHYG